MICGKCGKPLYDGDDFCVHCGANRRFTAAAAETKRKVAIYKAIICVAVVVALVAGIGLIGWYTGYEYAIKKYFRCIETNDGARMCNGVYLRCRKEYRDHLYGAGETEEDDQRAVERMHRNFGDYFGADFKITYEITDNEQLTGDALESLERTIQNRYAYSLNSDGRNIRITDAYKVQVTYTVSGSEDTKEYKMIFTVVKENGKWRIH